MKILITEVNQIKNPVSTNLTNTIKLQRGHQKEKDCLMIVLNLHGRFNPEINYFHNTRI